MRVKTIIFTGGGTLGHVYPMIPVIKEIRRKYPSFKIFFIGSQKGLEKKIIENISEIDEKEYLNVLGIERKITIKNIKAIFLVYKNYYYLKKRFKKIKPDMVIGFGGYVTGSVLKTAIHMKIKTIIHEQNSVLGLANKLVIKKVDKVLLTFPIKNVKGIIIGNPRISDFYQKRNNKINEIPRSILVFGGSNGADKINDIIIQSKEEFTKNDYKVTLITGRKYYQKNYDKIIQNNNANLVIKEFENNMFEEMMKNSLIIARAGSTTISETMGLKKICIFIPSPNVTNDHQTKNAIYYENNNAAFIIKEEDLNIKILLHKINFIIDNYFVKEEMKKNIEQISMYDSCERFVMEMEKLWK